MSQNSQARDFSLEELTEEIVRFSSAYDLDGDRSPSGSDVIC